MVKDEKKNYHIQGQLAQDSSQRINFQDGQRSFQHVYLTHTKCNNNFADVVEISSWYLLFP